MYMSNKSDVTALIPHRSVWVLLQVSLYVIYVILIIIYLSLCNHYKRQTNQHHRNKGIAIVFSHWFQVWEWLEKGLDWMWCFVFSFQGVHIE